MPRLPLALTLSLLLAPLGATHAADTTPAAKEAPVTVRWNTADIAGKAVTVPTAGKLSLIVFVMPDQPQSQSLLKHLQSQLGERKDLQPVAVVSGEGAEVNARKLLATDWSWPIVADPAYDASAKMVVRVWPTTVIVRPDGVQAAHIGGFSESYLKDLPAHLDFAAGKIDRAALDSRLVTHEAIADVPYDGVQWHVQLATKLLESGKLSEARDQVNRGFKASATDPHLLLLSARIHLLAGEAQAALDDLGKIDPAALPTWRVKTLRGRALIGLGQWDQARSVLTDAVRLNPDPSEAHYALGLVCQHANEWQRAAEAYRLAFETSAVGKGVASGK